jgi:hypothetical protein
MGWLFTVLSPSRNFHLYADITITINGEGLQNLGLGLWAGRDLYRITTAMTWDLGFSDLIRRTAPFQLPSYNTQGRVGAHGWICQNKKKKLSVMMRFESLQFPIFLYFCISENYYTHVLSYLKYSFYTCTSCVQKIHILELKCTTNNKYRDFIGIRVTCWQLWHFFDKIRACAK